MNSQTTSQIISISRPNVAPGLLNAAIAQVSNRHVSMITVNQREISLKVNVQTAPADLLQPIYSLFKEDESYTVTASTV